MLNISNELKAKLLAAQSAEEAGDLVKKTGKELASEESLHIWEEIIKLRKRDGKELSLDELEAVSGGADRDWLSDGCAATVEPGSWCSSNDRCYWLDVTYDHQPVTVPCPVCGNHYYTDTDDWTYVIYKCRNCGHAEKRNK